MLTTPSGDTALPVARRVRPQPGVPVAQWSRLFVRQLLVADAVCAVLATTLGWFVRFGFSSDAAVDSYLFFGVVITAGWIVCLHAVGGYDVRHISTGAGEYQRVLRATMNLAGVVAITAYLTHVLVARTFLAIVFPVGAVLMVTARYFVRQAVHARRRNGRWTSAILAVGTSESVRHLVEVLSRNPEAGLVVVAACVEDAAVGDEVGERVPVVGDINHASAMAAHLGVDIVAVAGAGLGPRRIRELGWALEGTGRNMVMAPGLTEVAGPRVHVSPVEGLPLMWVDQPQFTGVRRIVKRGLDLVGAALILVLASPFLLVVGVLVMLTSRGFALYRSTRMGQDGLEFRAYKFRSMYHDADQRRVDLIELNESDGGVLFKMRRDPRVTPVGRFLRRFSLDELPQLFNVIGGSMSLVGPRPPLPGEVERYHPHVHRRLLVKPGMTGLWQVSGRSDLSWDESVRLDLYYVENWSLALDLAIIARTVWAVIRARGAY
ncbi:MAG: polyprenyl glycosylphosphotransferase [Pseudonocardiales bacterium]|nr:MAG: polyprenyl glycosylphosphotransferase [Pseudonocardiales bacterium]